MHLVLLKISAAYILHQVGIYAVCTSYSILSATYVRTMMFKKNNTALHFLFVLL
jgi:hypothetical protein